jgi:peptidoglycan/xylan/chitin deacetylase (PgdA/CDA1 family)
MPEKNLISLTFDLEEFDIPEEYGCSVSHEDQMHVSRQGTLRLAELLGRHDVVATFFTTANYARQNTGLVEMLAKRHEIASHGLYHSPFYSFQDSDFLESKQILEAITREPVTGFRMPRLKPFSMNTLANAGYKYDSSLNPTYLPGRYNLLHEDPLPHVRNGVVELPCSTTPLFRFPLFWLSFKNLPLSIYAPLCWYTLRRRKSLMLYFHPWEFADIAGFGLPGYIRNPDGEKLLQKLEDLIVYLKKKNGVFVSAATLSRTLE